VKTLSRVKSKALYSIKDTADMLAHIVVVVDREGGEGRGEGGGGGGLPERRQSRND
jgi:hypothetical protein